MSDRCATRWTGLSVLMFGVALWALSVVANEPAGNESPTGSGIDAASFVVPDGSTEELLAFIRWTKDRFVEGTTFDERVDFVARQQRAIWRAADKILGLKPQHKLETAAWSEKLAALWELVRLGKRDALVEAVRVSKQLQGDARQELADRAEFFLLWQRVEHMATWSGESSSDEAAALVDDVVRKLEAGNRDKTLITLALLLPEKLQGSYPVVARGGALRMADVLGKSDDPFARRTAKFLRSIAKRLSIAGQTVEFSGDVFPNGELPAGAFHGRVVLVEFWATWCRPCIAEIPAIRSEYAKYHDRGFEVVGVSMDEDRPALASFLKTTPLPWTILCGRSADDSGMQQPMVVKYSIDTAGRNFVVDRQGRIVALDVHGEALQTLIERLLDQPVSQDEAID